MNLFRISPLNVTTINNWTYICSSFLLTAQGYVRWTRKSAVVSPLCDPCLSFFLLGMCPSFRCGEIKISFWAQVMTNWIIDIPPQKIVIWSISVCLFVCLFFQGKDNYSIIHDSSIFRLSLVYTFENQADRKIVPNHECGAWKILHNLIANLLSG